MNLFRHLAWVSPLICMTIITTAIASEPADPESAVLPLDNPPPCSPCGEGLPDTLSHDGS